KGLIDDLVEDHSLEAEGLRFVAAGELLVLFPHPLVLDARHAFAVDRDDRLLLELSGSVGVPSPELARAKVGHEAESEYAGNEEIDEPLCKGLPHPGDGEYIVRLVGSCHSAVSPL